MKRIVTSILTVALSLTLLSSLASCGSREKTDLSGVQNISELSGATLGAQTGTFHLTALDQVDGITKKDYPDFTDLLNAVKSGAIDGYVAEEPTAYDVCAKDDTFAFIPLKNNDTGFTATDEETGIAVAFKKGSDMTAQVSEIISSVSRETREELMRQVVEINASPDTEYASDLVLTIPETDGSNGTLKVAMECAYAPYNWTQTTDANGAVSIANAGSALYANGYDVIFAKYIAATLGMNLEVYSYEWDSLIAAVQSGAVDAIAAGMSPTAERAEQVDFTDCYYNSNLVIIYKK